MGSNRDSVEHMVFDLRLIPNVLAILAAVGGLGWLGHEIGGETGVSVGVLVGLFGGLYVAHTLDRRAMNAVLERYGGTQQT